MAATPPDDFPSCVHLADFTLTAPRIGPRRYLETQPDSVRLILAPVFAAPTDEAFQRRFARLKTIGQRRLFFRLVGMLSLLRHYWILRRAKLVFCQAPHYFWWLLLLHRLHLFPMRDRRVVVIYFLGASFLRRLAWWKSAPPGFHACFVSREQVRNLESKGCPPARQSYLPWRIDTDWFQPMPNPTGGYLVVAGNIHRDESLVMELARNSPLPIVRAGHLGRLRDLYRNSHVPLHFNLTHSEYLQLIQNAGALLLPIEPCDEPAGLTAALEALACGIPVIANASLEVGELLERAVGLAPLPDLRVDTWRAAIDQLAAGSLWTQEMRARGRSYVTAAHAIPPADAEWAPVLGGFAEPAPAC